MEVKVYNQEGSEIGTINLNEKLFGAELKPHVVHQYVVNYLANQRQGNANSKTRAEVAGGGSKPWRQKGTGRARAGTNSSPIWRSGGVTFGPKPRCYYNRFPKRMKRVAQISAFSDKAQSDNIKVIDNLQLPEIKTRNMVAILDRLGLDRKKCLILDEGVNGNLVLSVQNLQNVKYCRAGLANTYDIINADVLLFTKAGLEKVEEVFAS
ncbi:MAG: 50S ribosomal protein L4 [Candidatus Zixiibacteriota bacterium]|nr:MAG: 50S ribosomal protein L4 [candidate division Zixibacteria bacterium]